MNLDLTCWISQSFDLSVLSSYSLIDADLIPWTNLQWDNLDWANFNISAIQWTSPKWLSTSWSDLVGDVRNGVSGGVCHLMTSAVQLSAELSSEGSCSCNSSNSLTIDCDFAEICVDSNIQGDAQTKALCSSVNMTLNFDNLSGVENEVCMDFVGDTHPKTCYSYTIPFADQTMQPKCSATYGDSGECVCTIGKDLCITVDC